MRIIIPQMTVMSDEMFEREWEKEMKEQNNLWKVRLSYSLSRKQLLLNLHYGS